MKDMKKLFLSVFALSAMLLSACSGGKKTPSSSAEESSATSEETSAEESSETSGEEETSGGDYSYSDDESSSDEESSSEEDESSDEDESSEEEPEFTQHYVSVGGEQFFLYADPDYDPFTDLWGGVAKYISVPLSVTAGDSISVHADGEAEEIYANGANEGNNVTGAYGSYTVRESATDVILALYQYTDGWAFNLDGYSGGGGGGGEPEPEVLANGFYLTGDATFFGGNSSKAWKPALGITADAVKENPENKAEFKNIEVANNSHIQIVGKEADQEAYWLNTLGDTYSFASKQGTGMDIHVVFSQAGTYNFYVKDVVELDGTHTYIWITEAGGGGGGGGEPEPEPEVLANGFYLTGDATFFGGNADKAWKPAQGITADAVKENPENKAEFKNVEVANNSHIQIVGKEADQEAYWLNTLGDTYSFASKQGSGLDEHIVFSQAGTYNFYVKDVVVAAETHTYIWITEAGGGGGGGGEPEPEPVPAYSIHAKIGSEWGNTAMVEDGEEYKYVTGLALGVGDLLKIKMANDDDWRGWSQVKQSTFATTNFKAAASDDNIEVKVAGTYDIYVGKVADASGDYEGQSIWFAAHSVSPEPEPEPDPIPAYSIHAKIGSEWGNTAMVEDGEEYKYVTGLTLGVGDLLKIKMANDDDWRGWSQVKQSEFATACFKAGSADDNIEVKVAGTYDIYVGKVADASGTYTGKSIWIVEHPTYKNITVALDTTFSTQFSGRTYFVYSWNTSGANKVEYFNAAGTVSVLSNAGSKFVIGALKSGQSVLGEDWVNVDKQSADTAVPNTSVTAYWQSSTVKVGLDGAAPAAPTLYEQHFDCVDDVGDGNAIYVVGAFTGWAISEDYRLAWSTGNHWVGDFEFEAGTYEFKYISSTWNTPSNPTDGTGFNQWNQYSVANLSFTVPNA